MIKKHPSIVHLLIAACFALGISTSSGSALEAYSQTEEKQFLDWCTGEQKATDSVCSCTLKSVAQTVPASALISYINGKATGSGFSMSNLAVQSGVSAATAVTAALATCSG